MPYRNHVSFFGVWQETGAGPITPPPPPPPDPGSGELDLSATNALLTQIRDELRSLAIHLGA